MQSHHYQAVPGSWRSWWNAWRWNARRFPWRSRCTSVWRRIYRTYHRGSGLNRHCPIRSCELLWCNNLLLLYIPRVTLLHVCLLDGYPDVFHCTRLLNFYHLISYCCKFNSLLKRSGNKLLFVYHQVNLIIFTKLVGMLKSKYEVWENLTVWTKPRNKGLRYCQ